MSDSVTVSAADAQAVSYALAMAALACGPALSQVPGFAAALEANARLSAALAAPVLPEDPVGGMDELAIHHHELMAAYQRAGFEPEQAFAMMLTITQATVTAGALRGASGT